MQQGVKRPAPRSRTPERYRRKIAWLTIIAESQPAVCAVIQTARATRGKGMQSYLTMMAVRLLEMRRVLKDTGSIYLHCDQTASHYLKLLMDAIFGHRNFKNEIIWRRTAGRSDSKRFGRVHDTIPTVQVTPTSGIRSGCLMTRNTPNVRT